VHNSVREEITRRVVELFESKVVGDPQDHITQVGCQINEEAAIEA